ncbi:transposase [Streptomyces sp. NPDC056796]|uniref:transposase n=1 Tax=Streptomyces sp. NPDC056796 TaxID=3345947 RepID=UPI003697DAD2
MADEWHKAIDAGRIPGGTPVLDLPRPSGGSCDCLGPGSSAWPWGGGLTHQEWARLTSYLSESVELGGRRESRRWMVNGIPFRQRTKVPWRDLPARSGRWRTGTLRPLQLQTTRSVAVPCRGVHRHHEPAQHETTVGGRSSERGLPAHCRAPPPTCLSLGSLAVSGRHHALTDSQWERNAPSLPNSAGKRGRPWSDRGSPSSRPR